MILVSSNNSDLIHVINRYATLRLKGKEMTSILQNGFDALHQLLGEMVFLPESISEDPELESTVSKCLDVLG